MSQPRSGIGHSIPVVSPLGGIRALRAFWSNPGRTVRGWRESRRWPRPEDFDQMSPQAFDAYVERIGFDARIKAALAEPVADASSPDRERVVSEGQGIPQP
jgi:hypothetical protein